MLTRILLFVFIAVFATEPYALSAEAGQKSPLPPRKAPTKKKAADKESKTSKRSKEAPLKDAPLEDEGETSQFELEYARGEYFNVEARAYYWPTTFTANFATSSKGIEGDLVDYVNDLGLEEEGGFPAGEITFKLSERNKIMAGLVFFDMHGEGTMPISATINGVKYEQGVQTETDLSIRFFTVTYELDVVRIPQGFLAVRLALDMVEMQTSVVAHSISVLKNENTISIAVPKVGVAGRVNVNDLISVTGGVSAVGFDENYFLDGSVYVDVNPAPNFGVFVGYKIIRLEINVEEAKGEIEWSGLMAGVAVRF